MSEGIQIPSKEEMRAFIEKKHRMDDMASSLTEEERNHICDTQDCARRALTTT